MKPLFQDAPVTQQQAAPSIPLSPLGIAITPNSPVSSSSSGAGGVPLMSMAEMMRARETPLSGQTLNFADQASGQTSPWQWLPWNKSAPQQTPQMSAAIGAGFGGSPMGMGIFSP